MEDNDKPTTTTTTNPLDNIIDKPPDVIRIGKPIVIQRPRPRPRPGSSSNSHRRRGDKVKDKDQEDTLSASFRDDPQLPYKIGGTLLFIASMIVSYQSFFTDPICNPYYNPKPMEPVGGLPPGILPPPPPGPGHQQPVHPGVPPGGEEISWWVSSTCDSEYKISGFGLRFLVSSGLVWVIVAGLEFLIRKISEWREAKAPSYKSMYEMKVGDELWKMSTTLKIKRIPTVKEVKGEEEENTKDDSQDGDEEARQIAIKTLPRRLTKERAFKFFFRAIEHFYKTTDLSKQIEQDEDENEELLSSSRGQNENPNDSIATVITTIESDSDDDNDQDEVRNGNKDKGGGGAGGGGGELKTLSNKSESKDKEEMLQFLNEKAIYKKESKKKSNNDDDLPPPPPLPLPRHGRHHGPDDGPGTAV